MKREKLTHQIRQLIKNSGLSGYRVAKETGVDQAAISRFLSGKRGLSSDALDRIGELLNVEIIMHGAEAIGSKPVSRQQSNQG